MIVLGVGGAGPAPNTPKKLKMCQTNQYMFCQLATIVLQLFAYYIAVGKKLNVDQPRNLAKSVTVE